MTEAPAPRGPQGAPGQQGQRGRPGERGRTGTAGISAGAKRAIIALLVLVLIVGGGNLWATYGLTQSTKASLSQQQKQYEAGQRREQAEQRAAQQKAGLLVETKLCTDLGTMARIPAPSGAAAANPSRAYEQAEHRAWQGLVNGLECNRIGDKK